MGHSFDLPEDRSGDCCPKQETTLADPTPVRGQVKGVPFLYKCDFASRIIDNIQKTWNLDDVWSEVSLIMELWVVVVWGVSVGNFS